MNAKIISAILIFGLITVIPTVYGQLTLGSEANQELIEVKINLDGEVSVKHIVRPSSMGSTLFLFPNSVDLPVMGTNEMGEEKQLGVIDDGLGNKSIFVL